VNEELTTLNTELRDRNSDLGALNDDLVNLLASIQVPVIIVGSDLRIRRYTAGAERLVNVIPSDVGRAIGDITPKIDTPDLVALARQVMETLGGVEREVRDDAGHWYALRIRPYKTTAQKIDGAVMVFQDIDERRRHELALDEARRYAEAIVDTVREPLVVLDGALRVRSANRAFYDTFHLSAPETERRSFFDLGDGLWNTPRLRALLEDVLPAQSSVESFEVEHAFRTIGHRILRLNARELHLNHGSARLILLAIEDVTERRRLEQRTHFLAETGVALGASVDYDAVLESITRLAVPTLADWCLVDIEDVNGALRRVAVSGPDPAGVERARRIAAADAAADHPLSQVLRTAEPMVVDEAPAAMVDGLLGAAGHVARTPVPPARSLAIVPLRAGTRVRGVITFVAATAARRFMPGDLELAREFARRAALALENATLYREAETARAAAEAANRSKVDFLATMSHELRTPLNAILGYAQLLQMDIHGALTDAQRRAVHRIEAGQRHLTDLINDVLHFAKLEAGHVHVTITDVPVQPMLAEIDDLISAQMRRRQLHYERRACDPGIAVRAEEGHVRQIVLNLLSNAAKFTGAGGSVVLSCDFDEHSVRIRITDSGIGIAEEKRSVIFEPFVQLDSGLTRTAEGTGLGLAISRDLARAMYGDLEVTGAEGGGSTFTLTLPRARVLEQ
jgi:signal transduction histidine kinase/PAS domain-containing protein